MTLRVLDGERETPRGRHALLAAARDTLIADGAVIVRGFVETPQDFASVTELFASDFVVHHNPSRRSYSGDGRTKSVTPGTGDLPLHSERAYLPDMPEIISFCCIKPTAHGGYTTICDGAELLRALSADARSHLAQRRARWTTRFTLRSIEKGRGDSSPISESTATALADRLAIRPDAHCRVHGADDEVVVEYDAPCLSCSVFTQQAACANYLLFQDHSENPSLSDPDGGPFDRELVAEIAAAARALTSRIEWRAHDVAILDNTRMMHGRTAFSGERVVLTRMGRVAAELLPGHRS